MKTIKLAFPILGIILSSLIALFNMEIKTWLISNWRLLIFFIGIAASFLPLIWLYAKWGIKDGISKEYKEALQYNKELEIKLQESFNHNKQLLENCIWGSTINESVIKYSYLEKMSDEEQFNLAISLFEKSGIPIWNNDRKRNIINLEDYSKTFDGRYFGFRKNVFEMLKKHFLESQLNNLSNNK